VTDQPTTIVTVRLSPKVIAAMDKQVLEAKAGLPYYEANRVTRSQYIQTAVAVAVAAGLAHQKSHRPALTPKRPAR
jgi:hypothetical protein